MAKLVKLLDLESFDNGQHRPPFIVPVGETIIGRGEFLKCKSTEVSRSHAVLKADKDGNLLLTTINKKPCYYKKCGKLEKTVLKENESVQLQHGDVFSLTIASSGYEVQVSDDLSSGLQELKDNQELHSKIVDSAETSKVLLPSTKRKFPSWMEDSDDEELSSERKKTTVSEEKNGPTDDTKQSKETTNRLGLLGASDHDQGNNQNSNECVTVSPESKKDNLNPIVTTDLNNIQSTVANNNNSDKSNDTVFDPNEEQNNSETDAAVVVNQNILDVPSTSQVTSQRPLCMYADKCYRKNPQHKADFCHPEDSDYQAQQTTATSKQCCPYGTSCYRVNPQHKRDFDHTQSPVSPPQTPTKQIPRKARHRKATSKKKTGHWDSGSDESYDGSFIDDDENSSDDYRPDDDTEGDDEDWE